jgi:hypothetical protein
MTPQATPPADGNSPPWEYRGTIPIRASRRQALTQDAKGALDRALGSVLVSHRIRTTRESVRLPVSRAAQYGWDSSGPPPISPSKSIHRRYTQIHVHSARHQARYAPPAEASPTQDPHPLQALYSVDFQAKDHAQWLDSCSSSAARQAQALRGSKSLSPLASVPWGLEWPGKQTRRMKRIRPGTTRALSCRPVRSNKKMCAQHGVVPSCCSAPYRASFHGA